MKIFLTFLSDALSLMCCWTHPLVELEIFLTGRHCNLAMISFLLSEKYNLNTWKKPEKEDKNGV